jgi:hypothetical protein
MNTGINPVDGFEFKAHRFSVNTITNDVQITPPLSTNEARTYASFREHKIKIESTK